MKILMISPQFRPIVGGYERAAERLSRALAGRGHTVAVIAERRYVWWLKHELFEKVVVYRWWCVYLRGFHTLTSLLGFLSWIVIHGRAFQIWHVHQYGMHATLAVLLGGLLRRPVVLKLTSSGPNGLSASLGLLRFKWLHRWAHRRVTACVAISQETWQEALDFGIPEAKIRKISNGISTQEFRPPSPDERTWYRKYNQIQSEFLVVAIGRLAPMKNPLGLLKAWAYASCFLSPSAMLVWVGDGPQRREVEAAISDLGLADRVFLPGLSDDVYSWFAAADIFVLPSHTEGMSNSLLEAMSCGLPSVATAVSGTSELLVSSSSGLVVPVGDMQAFAEAIVTLAQDGDARLDMGARAREAVAPFSLAAVSEQVETLYKELLCIR